MTDHATTRTHSLHVVEPRAAGLDVHKLQLTVWLREQGVEAAAIEGAGICWEPPYTTPRSNRRGCGSRCFTRSKARCGDSQCETS